MQMHMDRRDSGGVLMWGLSLILTVAAVQAGAKLGFKSEQCELTLVKLHSVKEPGLTEINPTLNSPLTLICSSRSSGEFTWFKNQEKLISSNSSEYKIDAVKSDDGGEYQCAVINKFCGVVKSNPLTINTPPSIPVVLGESRVAQGGTVSLSCLAAGWPAPLIQWSHGGHVIHTGQQYSISSAQLSDSGKYVCTATNTRETANSTHFLIVQGHQKTSNHPTRDEKDGRVRDLRSATDDNMATSSPGGGGKLGSSAFIGIILVCVILGVAMIIVIIVVSVLCCIAVCRSCRRWMDSRKTGDKARLIPASDDDISEVFDHEKIRKNGSVAMVGVNAAQTAQDTKKKSSKPQKKKKKPKAGIKSTQVQPMDTDSDKVPIITHVDSPLAEDGDLTETRKSEKWSELVMVENGVKSEEEREERRGDDDNNMAEDSVISMIGADDEEVRQVRVKADVSPETAGQSLAQPLASPMPPATEEEHITTAVTISSAGETETEHGPVDGSVEIVEPATSTVIAVETDEPTTKVTYIEPEISPVVAEQTEEPAKVEVPGHEPPHPEEPTLPPPPTEAPPPPPPTEAPPPEESPPLIPPHPPAEEEADEEFLAEKAKKLGKPVSFVKQLTRSRPLTMGQISQLVYGQDDTDGTTSGNPLVVEYNSIPQNTPTLSQTAAEKEKNRYRNVLPNPHSIVKLKYTGQDGSTYINANYIQGYKMENAYIATQGPTADTMEDFWRMVWEKNVSIIVMLTGIIERGRHKCAKYWPHPGSGNGKLEYGTIAVQNNSETVGRHYNISNITISDLQKSAPERQVYHFAYKAWPDFGVPKESDSLLNLVEVVNKYRQQQSDTAPIVVHCSAGLGRSGTFMAIDIGIHQFEEEDQVNPLKYMCDMRSDRGGTVQTPEQYVFIHKALADYMMARK